MRNTATVALLLAGCALLVGAAPATAAPDEPGLPARNEVAAALTAHPRVDAARARTEAARADAAALARGTHEFGLTASYASRTVNDGSGVANGRFDEFEATLIRAVRLPGKAALDRRIGEQGVRYADNMAEDARHQAALLLAQLWWDWLAAAQTARVNRQAVANQEALLASVRRRAQLGDAALLEVDQAAAAVGAAQASAEREGGREAVAKARLHAQFPDLVLPATAPDLPEPRLPREGLATLHDLILQRSHELAAAEALSRQAEAQADRARRERSGDPSFGIRVFSDKGGMEKGAGLLFSLPFGGGYRSAQSDRATAQAVASAADLEAVRRGISETANADLADAQSSYAAWQGAQSAQATQRAALDKVRRGQRLGELGLADVLLAERLMHEAALAEAAARADALRAITRIRIDSHRLWIDDDEPGA